MDNSAEGLFIKEGRTTCFVPYTDLLWAKAEGNYIALNIRPDRTRLTRNTMIKLNDQLPGDHFIRVHKTYVVNISYVTGISGSNVFIGQHKIPVGRIYKKETEKRLSLHKTK